MTSTDYIIDIALIAIVILQLRARRMDLRALTLPVIAVGAASVYYLKAVPGAGHDVTLDLVLGAIGAALGVLCALATRVWRGPDGIAWCQAGVVAAVLWIVGIGSRLAFEEYTTHGGNGAVTRFSIAHQITGTDAWTAALVIMAVAEVIARLVVLRLRGRSTVAVPSMAA